MQKELYFTLEDKKVVRFNFDEGKSNLDYNMPFVIPSFKLGRFIDSLNKFLSYTWENGKQGDVKSIRDFLVNSQLQMVSEVDPYDKGDIVELCAIHNERLIETICRYVHAVTIGEEANEDLSYKLSNRRIKIFHAYAIASKISYLYLQSMEETKNNDHFIDCFRIRLINNVVKGYLKSINLDTGVMVLNEEVNAIRSVLKRQAKDMTADPLSVLYKSFMSFTPELKDDGGIYDIDDPANYCYDVKRTRAYISAAFKTHGSVEKMMQKGAELNGEDR